MTMPMPNDGLSGLAPVKPQKLAGIMPNAQHQTFHGFMTGAPYELAIVEFDDQGRCYDRRQMDAVAAELDALAPEDPSRGQDVIVVAFVHGWKHDARSDDDNLSAFRVLLERDGRLREGDERNHRQAPSSPRRLCRLARSFRLRPWRRCRERDLLGAAGGRTAGRGWIGARAVREATPLPQSPVKSWEETRFWSSLATASAA